MGEMTRNSGGGVRITIPLEISVRLGRARGTSSGGEETSATIVQEVAGAAEAIAGQSAATATPVAAPPPAPAMPALIRNRDALRHGPLTFRDHFLSLYQSMVAEIAEGAVTDKKAAAAGYEAATDYEATSLDAVSDLVLAAERIAEGNAGARAMSAQSANPVDVDGSLERMSPLDHAATCAGLGWELMKAKISGDDAGAKLLQQQLNAGSCDPRWADTITEYMKYFGPFGSRREPLYVAPKTVGDRVITIKSGSRIALLGDWGTGADPALRVLQQVKQQDPDILIHLGDIYYSGTEAECRGKFETPINETFKRPESRLPVYTLAGNHDMYCGGVGYYALIKRLNKGIRAVNGRSMVQPASFFCLRAEDSTWQLLAMDTGRHDYSPFSVADVVTFVDSDEQNWLRERVQEFDGKTILLSHHQLFSAFSRIGGRFATGKLNPVNSKLLGTYQLLAQTGRPIAAWFWGHEHNLCIYQPYSGLARGRCLGHGAIPVFADDNPYEALDGIDNPPMLVEGTKLAVAGQFYAHGFAMLKLGADGTAAAEYFQVDDRGLSKSYFEVIS
jgi:hypothetical protein